MSEARAITVSTGDEAFVFVPPEAFNGEREHFRATIRDLEGRLREAERLNGDLAAELVGFRALRAEIARSAAPLKPPPEIEATADAITLRSSGGSVMFVSRRER